MKTLFIAAVVGVMGLGVSAASAAPAQTAPHLANSPLVLAQGYGHDHHDRRDYGRDHRPRYEPGRRYRTAPHGWHRYSRRPGDWRTRGCILAGPVWFCP